MDILGAHTFVCKNDHLQNRARNKLHANLSRSVKELFKPIMTSNGFNTQYGEPQLDPFFDRIPQNPPRRNQSISSIKEVRNRADICYYDPEGREKAILIDVTTKSPLCADTRKFHPGAAADEQVKKKIKDYKSHHNIEDTSKANIFFFALDTSGAPSREAKRLCQHMAALSGGTYSVIIQRLYQKLSVDFQINMSQQIDYTINYNPSQTIPTSPNIPVPSSTVDSLIQSRSNQLRIAPYSSSSEIRRID